MKKLFLFIIVSLVFNCAESFGQDKKKSLFETSDILEIEIYFDIPGFLNSRIEEYKLPAQIAYFDSDSAKHELDAKIRVRGNFRKRAENCEFPPYSLYFISEKTSNTIFANQSKIKFVSHCNDGLSVLEEYLIYKSYAILTDNAYKVRLANVNYVDLSGDIMAFNEFAFFLENTKKMGERLNGKIVKPDTIYVEELDELSIAQINLFNYMIGNTDWDLSLKKNFKYVAKNDLRSVPIPYDFDLAEVINTYYPTHESIFGKESAKRRTFKCLDIDKKVFFEAISAFKAKKGEIYDLYLQFPYLSNSRKVEILNYYEEFFDKLKYKRKVYRELKKVCRK